MSGYGIACSCLHLVQGVETYLFGILRVKSMDLHYQTRSVWSFATSLGKSLLLPSLALLPQALMSLSPTCPGNIPAGLLDLLSGKLPV